MRTGFCRCSHTYCTCNQQGRMLEFPAAEPPRTLFATVITTSDYERIVKLLNLLAERLAKIEERLGVTGA